MPRTDPFEPSLHIDLQALLSNLRQVRTLAPRSRVLGMIKTDAYGCGLSQVAQALHDHTDALAVACLEDAAKLRADGLKNRIVLMDHPLNAQLLKDCVELRLDLQVFDVDSVEHLMKADIAPMNIWLKLDSGMHRLGLEPAQFADIAQRVSQAPQCAELICMSHMACADQPENPENDRQLQRLLKAASGFAMSMANSATICSRSAAHLDWVRPGLMLYGINPIRNGAEKNLNLRPVMRLEAPLLQIREIDAGEAVGYGRRWSADKRCRIGVLGIGYGDGYPFSPGDRDLQALFDGRRAPLIGRVSMDMVSVLLDKHPEAKVGDRFQMWGEQLPLEEVAAAAGLIPYALMTSVGSKIHRSYC